MDNHYHQYIDDNNSIYNYTILKRFNQHVC